MMKKKKTNFLLVSLLISFIFLLSACRQTDNINRENINPLDKIKIAACPTCFVLAQKLDKEKYQLIPTSSTAQSIAFLQSGQVDLILAGRTLKADEPRLDFLVIKDGYSFLANQEMSVYNTDLSHYQIYTDLNADFLNAGLNIENIELVDDVYQYLDKGIAITSWENTDYHRADLVHVLENNGQRMPLSRRPTIYCPQACGQEAREIATLLR